MKCIWLVEWLKWCGIYLAINNLRRPAGKSCHGINSVNTSLIHSLSTVHHDFSVLRRALYVLPAELQTSGRTPFPHSYRTLFFFFLPLSSQDGWERGSFRHHDGASSAGSSARTGDELFHRDGWRVPFFLLLLLLLFSQQCHHNMQSGIQHSLRSGNDSHVFPSLTLITPGRQQDACYCAFVVGFFSPFTSFTWLEDGGGGGGGWVGG